MALKLIFMGQFYKEMSNFRYFRKVEKKSENRKSSAGWMDWWIGGWMDGSKSRFKCSLHNQKIKS